MIKNKKTLTAILLMLVYAVLMFQEIAVNQVLCYKINGTVNLELAVLNFKCNCFEIHDHPSSNSSDPSQCSQLSCQFNRCMDQPLNTSWLERDINPTNPETHFINQKCPNDHIYIKIPEILNWFPTPGFLINLTKFLPNASHQGHNTSLRC